MPGHELQLSVRLPTTRKPIGLQILVPGELIVVPGPAGSSFHAVERRSPVRLLGEIDLTVITPGLIMDRDGVLRDAAIRAAEAFVAPPRDGYILQMGDIELPAGSAWRCDALMQRGKDGRLPELPYQSVLAMGHPDLSLPVALFITLHSATDVWPAAEELLGSLRFLGAPAPAALEATLMPLTF